MYSTDYFGDPVPVPGRTPPNTPDVFGGNSKYSFSLTKRPGQKDYSVNP